jgi:SPRY domain
MFTIPMLLLLLCSIKSNIGTKSRNTKRQALNTTPKSKNELAKQALSNYIDKIRFPYKCHPSISAESVKSRLQVNCDSLNHDKNMGFRAFLWDARICEYTVKIDEYPFLYIGFAPSTFKVDLSDVSLLNLGWYFTLHFGELYSQDKGIPFTRDYSKICNVVDTITCIYDASTSEISYKKNGKSLGVAFTNVTGEDIAPVIIFVTPNIVTLSAISTK